MITLNSSRADLNLSVSVASVLKEASFADRYRGGMIMRNGYQEPDR